MWPQSVQRLPSDLASTKVPIPGRWAGAKQGTTFVNTKGGNLYSDLVTLKYQGADIQKPVPMWIAPGQPDDVITLYMGYGRNARAAGSAYRHWVQRFR